MKLEDIHAQWAVDSVIDETELGHESAVIPQKQSKYLKIWTAEKLVLTALQKDLARLRFEKAEFYRDGPDEDSRARGWEMPARGRIIPALVKETVDNDHDVVALEERVALQEVKVKLVDEIVKSLNWRHNHIKNAIDFLKWRAGG